MKAMVLRAPNDVALEAVAEPKPGPNQVAVRVSHSGICGTDLKIYHGAIPVDYPRIMGHEMVGVVVEGGDDRIRNGQRVIVDPCLYCGVCHACRAGRTSLCPNGGLVGRDSNGGFAEYLIAPRSHIFPLPDAIDSRTAPLIQVLTTCLHGQRALNIFPGQSVVVMGSGRRRPIARPVGQSSRRLSGDRHHAQSLEAETGGATRRRHYASGRGGRYQRRARRDRRPRRRRR